MKSACINVRMVALSATVPNAEDIAAWLGRSTSDSDVPAHLEVFGEEFRPVRLQKHVYGYRAMANEYVFDQTLNKQYGTQERR